MIVSLIWAMARNRVIGVENRLPWKLPADMRWFREKTMGKPIVMGRKTFESFGAKPLPGRHNIIITRDANFKAVGATVVNGVEDALAAAGDAEEVMIIGGAQLYAQMLPRAQRLYLTLVDAEPAGDALFPEINEQAWREVEREEHPADEKNPHAYSFIMLERSEK